MPGLAGLVSGKHDGQGLRGSIDKMINLMLHETSYVTGKCVNNDFALGAVDLGKGGFLSTFIETDVYVLGFTGQIYDQEELSQTVSYNPGGPIDLPGLLLHINEKQGIEGLCGLNGLYICVLWNKRSGKLQLISDRYGFRKMYYWQGRDKFVFASEYKSICSLPDFSKKIDEYAFANFMSFGYVLDDRTFFDQIKVLPPASIATFEKGSLNIERYWDYSFYSDGDRRLSEDDYIDTLAGKLTNAVNKRVREVSKLVLPISGGLDSRTLAAVLKNENSDKKVNAYSYGHDHCYDVRFGKQIARTLGYDHKAIDITPDYIKDHSVRFQYLCEGTRTCDWAWHMIVHDIYSKEMDGAILSGFLGDALLGARISFGGVLNTKDDDTAVMKVYRNHIDAFDDSDIERYLHEDICRKVKNYNFEMIRQSYFRAPTENKLNRARYVNLCNRQRRYVSSFLSEGEFLLNMLSPFTDNEFVDFVLQIPPDLMIGQSLYRKMITKHFPEVAKIGYAGDGYPVQPSWWQAGMKWRKEKYKAKLKWLPLNMGNKHDFRDYRHPADALRSASREFMLEVFSNKAIKNEFYNERNFDNLVEEFLQSKTKRYEKVCYPMTFFVWADLFYNDK